MMLLVDTLLKKVHLFLLRYSFQAALHIIWQERNDRRHGETPNMSQIIQFIEKQM